MTFNFIFISLTISTLSSTVFVSWWAWTRDCLLRIWLVEFYFPFTRSFIIFFFSLLFPFYSFLFSAPVIFLILHAFLFLIEHIFSYSCTIRRDKSVPFLLWFLIFFIFYFQLVKFFSWNSIFTLLFSFRSFLLSFASWFSLVRPGKQRGHRDIFKFFWTQTS